MVHNTYRNKVYNKNDISEGRNKSKVGESGNYSGRRFFWFFLGKKWINSESERRTLHRAWAIAEGKWG